MTSTNYAPITRTDSATTTENTTITVDVLANDFDRNEGDELTLLSAKSSKTKLDIVDNKVVYTPLAGFVGEELIAYKVADQGGKETKGKLIVTVTEAVDTTPVERNVAPVTRTDRAETTINTSITVDVLANDFDHNEGDTLTLVSAKRGNMQLDIVDNKVVYTPVDGFVGEELISYKIADQGGKETKGKLFVTVTGGEPVDEPLTAPLNEPIKGIIGNDTNEVLTGDEKDNMIYGNGGKDFLAGLAGNDLLDGGTGNDTLVGGHDTGTVAIDGAGHAALVGGGDVLTGGAGNDIFKYTKTEGADNITDFQDNADKLILRGAFNLVDVANGTFVDFGGNQGIIVDGINSAALADDIMDITAAVA